MTNEQAIKELQESHDIMRNHDIDESESYLMQALNMAIKALQEQADRNEFYNWDASIRHKADGEYIPREAVIDIIEDVCPIYGNDYRYILREKVNELPSVAIPTEEPKTGHWIKGAGMWICNQCGYEKTFGIATKFCSQCGAKMGGEEDG